MQRVFIYGSCVTRDGVELWPDHGLEMAGYVARQSLISATAPAQHREFRTEAIASAFQRRMAEGDIRGNVLDKLTTEVDDYDVILWDITDERLGVYRVPSGGYVSRVVDYKGGIYRGTQALDGPVKIGSDAHRTLWLAALDKFLDRLDQLGVKDRLVLNALPWATKDASGDAVAASAIDPHVYNAILDDYSAEVENRGVKVARTDLARVWQDNDHKWGAAPFHYVDDTYRASLEALARVL